MRILALDPAAKTGYALGEGPPMKASVLQSGVWLITHDLDRHPGQRLERFEDFLLDSHKAWRFEALAYEKSTFGSHNPAVKELHAELAAVIRLVAARLAIPAWGYAIQTWKLRAVGNGGADKGQIIRTLATLYGIRVTSEDQADAVGILLAAQIGEPPEPKRATERRVRRQRKREPKLF